MGISAHAGHGIGLRRQHFGHLLENPVEGVDWFEIITENFFEPGGRPWAVLEKVRSQVPVVLHGVSLAIGNTAPIPEDYYHALETLIRRAEPAWISDHLCWGGHGGHNSHDLLPLPYTEECLRHVISRVQHVQDRLGRQILLENPSSYLTFNASTLTEWEFLKHVAEEADCGILLDVNNVFVSARNHGFDAHEYIAAIPGDRVGQIHLAGHTDHGKFVLDSHIGPIPDPVWELYAYALQRMGPKPTLVEWDDEVPHLDIVAAESARARRLEDILLGDARAA
jgi:uncharacterized protein